MTGLLPEAIRHAVASKSLFSASQSLGVVALVLLVVLLTEREVLRVARWRRVGQIGLSVVSAALLVVVTLTVLARLAVIVR